MSSKFGIGSLGLGSLGNMLESVDLVKKAWSAFNLPSTLTPTMDLEELDKRIADLKTVEQWLNVNLSMLRGTIQGMEIQRGTIAAVKAFGQAVTPGGEGLASMAQAAAQAANRAARSATPPPAPSGDSAASAPADRRAGPAADGGTEPPASLANELSRAAAAAVNPAAWWNLLQSQFNQVAQAAMTGAGLGEAVSAVSSRAKGTAPKRPAATATAKKPGGSARPRAKTKSPAARKAAPRARTDTAD